MTTRSAASAPTTARRPRPLVAGLALLLLAVLGAGCGVVGGPEDPAGAAPAGGTALADADVLEDPRSYLGPSTAVLEPGPLEVLADDPEPALPVTVTDAQGTEVTVTDVSRILPLDLNGTSSRIVYQLGLGDNIVGRDTSSGYPEVADLPLVTVNGHQLSGEAILDLNPSLIITDTSLGPWDVVLQMRDAGIPVVVIDSERSLENIEEITGQIAEAVGLPELGRELAERTESEVSASVERIAAVAPEDGLRMVFLYVRGGSGVYYMFGSGSGTDSLIEALGGVDVAGEIGWTGMRPLTDEALIEAQPELVLMMTKGLESVGGVDGGLFEHVPALAYTPAGESRRIVDMSDTEILGFGPNSAEVLEALAVAIYAPEAAAE